MRTDSVLSTAQQAPSYSPGVLVSLAGAGSITNLIELTHTEEPYGVSAVARFNNYDGAFDAYSMKGTVMQIGWGIGSRVSTAAQLWCYAQDFISSPGRDEYRLYAEGAWNKLARYTPGTGDDDGIAFYFNNTDGTPAYADYTIKDIISHIGSAAGVTIGTATTWDDGKINSFKPSYNMGSNTDGRSAVRTMLSYTKCVLIPSTTGLAIKYPTTADTVDPTYYSNGGGGAVHFFRNGSTRSVQAKPLKVVVTNTNYSGSATATGWSSEMGYLTYADDCEAGTSNAECDFIAQAIINRAGQEEDTGYLVAPMNCLQEVYDRVEVSDNRGNISGTGRVGIITRHFKASGAESRAVYDMEITLGGLQKDPNGPVTPLITHLTETDTNSFAPVNKVFPANVPKGYQANRVGITFYAKDDNEIYWDAGTITFADGDQWLTDALPSTAAYALVGTVNNYVYASQGTTTLQTSVLFPDTTSDKSVLCAIAKAASSTAYKAYILSPFGDSILINRDQVVNNLVGELQLASEAVTNAKIAAGAIYGAVVAAGSITHTMISDSAIQTNNIAASAVTAACIAASAVVAINIAASAVAAVSLAASCVTSEKIYGGAIVAGKIDALAVASSCIAASAITSDKIYAGAITTDKLAAGAVTTNKLAGIPSDNMIGLYNWSFESTTDYEHWTRTAGPAEYWDIADGTFAFHGGRYLAGCGSLGAGTVRTYFNDCQIACSEGDIVTTICRVAKYDFPEAANGTAYLGIRFYDSSDNNLGGEDQAKAATAMTNLTWYPMISNYAAPASAEYAKVYVGAGTSHTAGWLQWDAVTVQTASRIIMHGTPGGTRMEMTADGLSTYNGATRTAFIGAAGTGHYFKGTVQADAGVFNGTVYASAGSFTGVLTAGGGSVVANATALTLTGPMLYILAPSSTSGMYFTASGTVCGLAAYIGTDLLVSVPSTANNIILSTLPTSDPGVAGALYTLAGAVRQSAG